MYYMFVLFNFEVISCSQLHAVPLLSEYLNIVKYERSFKYRQFGIYTHVKLTSE